MGDLFLAHDRPVRAFPDQITHFRIAMSTRDNVDAGIDGLRLLDNLAGFERLGNGQYQHPCGSNVRFGEDRRIGRVSADQFQLLALFGQGYVAFGFDKRKPLTGIDEFGCDPASDATMPYQDNGGLSRWLDGRGLGGCRRAPSRQGKQQRI